MDSVESAAAAAAGGANRLELCANLVIGGTTPSQFLFEQVRDYCDLKIHVLIRPRFGDFCYTGWEFAQMQREVELYRQLGADGVVIGILNPDGTLDEKRLKLLMQEAGEMSVTLHRAFDLCADPMAALEGAVKLGFDTILTSGQADCALNGIELLSELRQKAGERVDILAGGGISAQSIRRLRQFAGLSCFHMSGKVTENSPMRFRRQEVSMGLPSLSEYEIWKTDRQKIAQARKALEELD